MKLHLLAATLFLSSTAALACENVTVEGMHCESCAKSIRKALLENPAVEKAEVDFETGLVKLECKKGQKLSRPEIEKAIKAAGADYKIKG